MIRVAIADDQELIRVGLRTILETVPDVEVVAEVGDGLSAVRLLDRVAVDLILMDIRMPGVDGVEATRRIRSDARSATVRILVLTTFDQDETVLTALKAGADGFLSKGAGPAELADAIRRVVSGEHALSARAVDAVVEHLTDGPTFAVDGQIAARFADLTAREREIVGMVVRGLTNRRIAEALHLSPLTVKTHVNRAMMKVDARDRAQLVSLAVRAGILP